MKNQRRTITTVSMNLSYEIEKFNLEDRADLRRHTQI